MTRRTRGSANLATSESRWVARARINRSLARSTCSTVIDSGGSTRIRSTISAARALTSHGCPRVYSNARVSAGSVNG